MKFALPVLSVSLFALLASGCASANAPPTVFPNFEGKATTSALFVADVSHGTRYPESEQCSATPQPSTPTDAPQTVSICMYSRFYFKVENVYPVYGVVPTSPYVGTASHWGTQHFNKARNPKLIQVDTDGIQSVMPLYKMYALETNKSGEHFLPLRRDRGLLDLCSLASLREELKVEEFVGLAVIPEDQISVEDKKSMAEYMIPVQGGFRPRYGVSMARLRAHMAKIEPGVGDRTCSK
ncbi:MAG: hypothetical protein V4857_23960 [Pseudomonadota bacterium]